MEHTESGSRTVKRVAVGIPLKGHTPPESYHDRMMMAFGLGCRQVEDQLKNNSPRYEFYWFSPGEIFIPFAREQLADMSLKYDCDYLFMVDDDMMTPPDLFFSLVRHDVDIVAPLAFTRNPPYKPVIYQALEGFDAVSGNSYYVNKTVFNYPKDQLVECDAVGFGAVLINTSVFKKMKPPYFMGSHGTGEDIYFCNQAKKLGCHIYMDTSVKLGHLSHPLVITEKYSQEFNKLSQEQKDKVFGDYRYDTMEKVQ